MNVSRGEHDAKGKQLHKALKFFMLAMTREYPFSTVHENPNPGLASLRGRTDSSLPVQRVIEAQLPSLKNNKTVQGNP